MDNNPKQQAIERLKQASNVLVTVSANPSVDQLAACIGLTLLLNKVGKHGTAVYSGQTPSTIEFLKPKETIEKNTDSLRDFIIALDKSKADKLRYKVEDKIVRIFITPYHTDLSEKDLEFSLGEVNVEVVVALGVHTQTDLDQAIMAHGRILHDATVISINNTPKNNNLGTINWQDTTASSLSEMVAGLASELGKDAKQVFDTQIATALLTGIVAETKRFSNNKTTAQTMSVSAQLITAGANQQLVATKLDQPPPPPPPPPAPPAQLRPPQPPASPQNLPQQPAPPAKQAPTDGTLIIDHGGSPQASYDLDEALLAPQHQIEIDQEGMLHSLGENTTNPNTPAAGQPLAPKPNVAGSNPIAAQAPTTGALPPSEPGNLALNTDPLSLPPVDVSLGEGNVASPQLPPAGNSASPSPNIVTPTSSLPPSLDNARGAVESAVLSTPAQPQDLLMPSPVQPPAGPNNSLPPISGPPPLAGSPTPPPMPAIESRHALDMPSPPTTQDMPAYNGEEDMPSGAPPPSPSEADASTAPPVPPPILPAPPVF